jgi:hypothetical protein
MAAADSTNVPAVCDARSSNGTPLYKCRCPDCGYERLADKRKLGRRCAPCAMKLRATHGLCGHPLFKLLMSIRVRCEQPSATNFEYYGGRGIAVCDAWKSDPHAFKDWCEANGYAPGLELDRIDTDGPYAPENCQFLTHEVNSQKRRNARCDLEQARAVKAAIAQGQSVRNAAATAGVPYMSAWHIAKGNTWRNTE